MFIFWKIESTVNSLQKYSGVVAEVEELSELEFRDLANSNGISTYSFFPVKVMPTLGSTPNTDPDLWSTKQKLVQIMTVIHC